MTRTIRLQSSIDHGVTVRGTALEITAYAALVAWTNSCNVSICHGHDHDVDDHFGDWGLIEQPSDAKEMRRRAMGIDAPEVRRVF